MKAGFAVMPWTLGAILLAGFTAPAEAQDTVVQWRRWEKTLLSSKDFSLGGGNPYKDLVLRVRFTRSGGSTTFTQDAFWEGGTGAAAKNFKVRAALPSGNWDWQVVGCTGSTGSSGNCAQGTTWAPSSGSISVTANTTSGTRLYDRGFLRQSYCFLTRVPPIILCGWGPLEYSDSVVPFYFAADTAWAAPPRENSTPSTAKWSSFVTSRKAKGFTAVLIAPAVAWQPQSGDLWPALPAASGFSFNQSGNCTEPIPNSCSKPNPTYWQKLDALIELANANDLVVGIVGVMDPVGLGTATVRYPNQANATAFARYLAARLAGNHVFYSPGFDTPLEAKSQQGTSASTVINAVGAALKIAAPRHLVTNHLAGKSTCDQYNDFASNSLAGWMTFYVFQSGHAKSVPPGVPPSSDPCASRQSLESPVRAAMRRAKQMPLTLRGYRAPVFLPVFNGEGPYDATGYRQDDVDNRYRLRQANHLSSLSDAMGVTYGAERIVFWDQPASYLDLGSARDMTTLANRFRNRTLFSRPTWLRNQPADPDPENEMALASDGASLVVAYMPGRQTNGTDPSLNNIVIGTAGLPSLNCGSSWTRKWVSAHTGTVSSPTGCSQSPGQINAQRPGCIPGQGSNPDCDWVLELQRTGAALTSPFVPSTSATVGVWVEGGDEANPPRLRFELDDPGVEPVPRQVLFAEEPDGYPASPRLARVGADYLVVWESEPGDGSLRGIFAQRVSAGASKMGSRLQVNSYTEHDQAEPAVASNAGGTVMIAWSSFDQDGDQGGIFARRFSPTLIAQGSEIQVNQETIGHQERPQIALDGAGNWVTAWTTHQGEDEPATVSWRKLSATGQPLGPQQDVAVSEDAVQLLDLQADVLGGFRVSWTRMDAAGESVAIVEQAFDSAGDSVGEPITSEF